MTLTPFLRWVGGKRRMAVDLVDRIECHLSTGRYIEPFLGAGAVALAMQPGTPMLLGDACKPVSYLWWWLKQEPEAIADYAAGYSTELGVGWNTQEGYVEARLQHNQEPFSDDDWRPSARFLWLMHAAFNGIYRENAGGLFNVPWGKRKKLALPTGEDLRAVAEHLVNAEIYPGADFADLLDAAEAGDVCFNDPPYDGDVTAFTSYTAKKFDATEQERLRDVSERAVDRGATVIMTNADTPAIRRLYRGMKIEEVLEDRPVAADPGARIPARCLIVTGVPR